MMINSCVVQLTSILINYQVFIVFLFIIGKIVVSYSMKVFEDCFVSYRYFFKWLNLVYF